MASGGTVTATLLLGNTIVDTATRPVAVSLGETVTITGLGANLNVGATDPFTVTASNLDTLSQLHPPGHDGWWRRHRVSTAVARITRKK